MAERGLVLVARLGLALLGEPAPSASEIAPELPAGWDPILGGLLIKNPRDRTPTLADLRGQLEALDL
ncbi:MAG: hypothetical protein ABIY55_23205, partial [Kofleriaceae bacterium]